MTVHELKCILDDCNDNNEVTICVDAPGGCMCPDGCTVRIKKVVKQGIDWHGNETLIAPEFRLAIKNADEMQNSNCNF